MVSIKTRTKIDIVKAIQGRTKNFVVVLDDCQYNEIAERAIRELDEALFNPRNLLLQSPGTMVDVTEYKIDEINNVYYPPYAEVNFMFGELGIIPFLSQGSSFVTLEGITDYLQTKSVLNMMNRHMDLDGDWSLFPPNADGTAYLQLRKPYELVQIEYLPYLDPSELEWNLYENEYRFILDWATAAATLQSSEGAMTAQGIGLSDNWTSIAQYWEKKLEKIKDKFLESSIITYLQ